MRVLVIKSWRAAVHAPRADRHHSRIVVRWAGEDADKILAYNRDETRDELWPWLLERGYATAVDEDELDPFLERVKKANRDAHLRPGLAVIRRWTREELMHCVGAAP